MRRKNIMKLIVVLLVGTMLAGCAEQQAPVEPPQEEVVTGGVAEPEAETPGKADAPAVKDVPSTEEPETPEVTSVP